MKDQKLRRCAYCGRGAMYGEVCSRCRDLAEADPAAIGGGAPLTEKELGLEAPPPPPGERDDGLEE